MYALKLFPVVCCYEWKDGNGLKKKITKTLLWLVLAGEMCLISSSSPYRSILWMSESNKL